MHKHRRHRRVLAHLDPELVAALRERHAREHCAGDHHHDHPGGARHHHPGRGFGPGGGFGPGPGGFGPRGGRRRRRRGETRLALLRLLADGPTHGYALMQELESRSEGRWRPSAGTIYPTLEQLADEGLVRSTESDGRRVYDLTDAGRELVAESADQPAPWEPVDDEDLAGPMRVGRAMMLVGAAAQQVAHAGSAAQQDAAIEVLDETRRRLYALLADASE